MSPFIPEEHGNLCEVCLRLTAVATTLDFIDMNYCTHSMCRLHRKSICHSSAAHCVATADVPQPFASLTSPPAVWRVSVVATRREVNPLLGKLTFAERTSPNCGKYLRNAHKPDLPKMEQLGLVRPALSGTYFPRRVSGNSKRHR